MRSSTACSTWWIWPGALQVLGFALRLSCAYIDMLANSSERLKKSESDGQRLKEALHINSSLSAVGKVVMSLDPESGYNYIPYRDSKLTRLLQNSIGSYSVALLPSYQVSAYGLSNRGLLRRRQLLYDADRYDPSDQRQLRRVSGNTPVRESMSLGSESSK